MLILLIFILALILQLFLPWWIIAPLAFGLSYWKSRNAVHAFGSGFIAIFLLWIGTALFYSIPNQNMLANRVAQVFLLPDMELGWLIMLLITGLLGGLVSGLAALAGFYTKLSFQNPVIK